jgi:hypothetical protein
MSATNHQAPYVLDGPMHHGTALRIGTHYTDTVGALDALAGSARGRPISPIAFGGYADAPDAHNALGQRRGAIVTPGDLLPIIGASSRPAPSIRRGDAFPHDAIGSLFAPVR